MPIQNQTNLTPEEKRECVLQSPRFGMFGLMAHMLEREGGRECSHVFGKQFLLPIFIFVAQWLMFAAIIIHNLKNPFACNSSQIEHKLLMTAIGMVYFVHSFYVEPKYKSTILTKTSYQNFEFCSAVQKEKIIGFQFHPEKSSFKGIQILKNFINLIKNDKK